MTNTPRQGTKDGPIHPARATATEPAIAAEKRKQHEHLRAQRPERRLASARSTQKKREERKAAGLCRDCGDPTIPGKSKCEICAEKHRVIRRNSATKRRERLKAEKEIQSQK